MDYKLSMKYGKLGPTHFPQSICYGKWASQIPKGDKQLVNIVVGYWLMYGGESVKSTFIDLI